MTQTLEQLSAAATWLRQCHDWMMTNDLDMQCPMETSPEDLAISLEAIIEDMTSPDDKVEVLFAYCCAEAGGRVAYCDCVKKAHGTVFLPDKQVGDHTRTGQLVAVADDAIERVKAEARNKALDEAAEAVCGYIHPAYGKLPGDPFATAVVRALKSPKPPIL